MKIKYYQIKASDDFPAGGAYPEGRTATFVAKRHRLLRESAWQRCPFRDVIPSAGRIVRYAKAGDTEQGGYDRYHPKEQVMGLNLNMASAEELDGVPGLEGHGFEIVRCREERGRFTSLRELNEVPGLANKLPDDLDSSLRVD